MCRRAAFALSLTLAVALNAFAEDDEEWPEDALTPRAEFLRATVADWCDGYLKHFTGSLFISRGQPFCFLYDEGIRNIYIGEWRFVDTRYWWWWRERTDPSTRLVVLWLAAPDHHESHRSRRVRAARRA